MKTVLAVLTCVLMAATAFAQSDRGTITGTITDTSNALISGARVTLTNVDTGTRSSTVTTVTGNYTLPGLPVGNYTLAVENPGFNKYEQTGIGVRVAVTTRIDVKLTVGAVTSTITVSSEVTLLKTESAEQSMTVTGAQLAGLPINFGIGAGAIRNALSFIQMTPGATFNGWNNISINGTSTFAVLFEGQDSTQAFSIRTADEVQPSVEAIEQFTLQTSNFSAEFGGIGNGGLYNFTSKSGTNQFHGSVYDYFQNTFLNAGIPFTNDGHDRHIAVVKHLSDGGFSVGGPVWIPKVYNGKNKTFFFFNLEKYRDRESLFAGTSTAPNSAFLSGDLSNNLLVTNNRNLGTDFAGRAIIQNAIYDPTTETIDSSGRRVLQLFSGNKIPQNRFDTTAVKIMALFPKPNLGNDLFVNNFTQSGAFFKLQSIPSIKIDHTFSDKIKMSFYHATQYTGKSNGVDGMAEPLSRVRPEYIRSRTVRVNYDQTITPTLLLHVGTGVARHSDPDTVGPVTTSFDPTTLGIVGAPGTGFPRIGSLGDNTYGGLAPPIGPGNRRLDRDGKLTAQVTLSWVHGNHTFKGGAEWKLDSLTRLNYINLSPAYTFSTAQTAQPLYGQALPSGTGIGSIWASFLLGQYDSVSIGNTSAPAYLRPMWSMYVQDTWKLSRKLTLDYGLRWDLQPPTHELWDRQAAFSPTVVNPNANGLLGGVIYAGSGAGRCNCKLVPTYPYALGPRLGVAYQFDPKTVIRGGWGLSYGLLAATATVPSTLGMGFNTVTNTTPGNGVAAGTMSKPLVYSNAALYGASYDPGLQVFPGQPVQAPPTIVDRNGGRPSRTNQWSISVQREVLRDLVVEAAFLGNHTVWLQGGGAMVAYNAVSPAVYQKLGLDITTAATRTLLGSSITSPVAVAAGFKKPYANFPDAGTVLQSLKPFPQYSNITATWLPLGSSWYDALQVKVTKRFSHGLTATASYAFSKTLDATSNAGNIYDTSRSSFKGLASSYLPHILSISVNYTLPTYGFVKQNRIADKLFGGWMLGTIQTYQSGPLLQSPASNNQIGNYLSTGYTRQVRVPGVPLYLKSLNCGCIDPTQETVLNPAAWVDQAVGVPGSNIVYYNDFRGQRRPIISGSLTKTFRIRERMSFSIRGEFFNLLNQSLSLGDPVTSSPATPPTRSKGLLTGGFGFVNYLGIASNSVNSTLPTPRTGQLVARFEF